MQMFPGFFNESQSTILWWELLNCDHEKVIDKMCITRMTAPVKLASAQLKPKFHHTCNRPDNKGWSMVVDRIPKSSHVIIKRLNAQSRQRESVSGRTARSPIKCKVQFPSICRRQSSGKMRSHMIHCPKMVSVQVIAVCWLISLLVAQGEDTHSSFKSPSGEWNVLILGTGWSRFVRTWLIRNWVSSKVFWKLHLNLRCVVL